MPERPFKNWYAKTFHGSKDDLIEKMRKAHRNLRFKPSVDWDCPDKAEIRVSVDAHNQMCDLYESPDLKIGRLTDA